MTERTDFELARLAEAAAMRRILRALDPLSADAKQRVIDYLVERFTDPKETT